MSERVYTSPKCYRKNGEPRADADWIEFAEYVKTNILCYDEKQGFPQNLAIRLKGLQSGVFMKNNNLESEADYRYDVLLTTAKLVKDRVLNYYKNNERIITGERHKWNLLCKFIEQEIDDVYIRVTRREDAEEKLDRYDISHLFTEQADFIQGEQVEIEDWMKEIW